MSNTSPQDYVEQALYGRYIKVKILEAFLKANAETFGEASTYDVSLSGHPEGTLPKALYRRHRQMTPSKLLSRGLSLR
jgi:hypothetical protein